MGGSGAVMVGLPPVRSLCMLRRSARACASAVVGVLLAVLAVSVLVGPARAALGLRATPGEPTLRTSVDVVAPRGDGDVVLPRHRSSVVQDRVHLLGLAMAAVLLVVILRRMARSARRSVTIPLARQPRPARAPPAPVLA
jgi:hypothetical protein